MPRVILQPKGTVVELPSNATLADALCALGEKPTVLLGLRRRIVHIVDGEERLSPPTRRERRRFGGVDWQRRLADQAGIIGESTITIRL